MALLLKHQTQDQFLTKLREAFRASEGERNISIGQYILAAIQRGDITDAAIRAKFGVTSAQWNTIRSKMQSRVTALSTIRNAAGE
jgi:hypothetical protein